LFAKQLSLIRSPDVLTYFEKLGLEAGHALGWFQGRMEFGPRALGARSILGDSRLPEMQQNLNLKIKYRESFRPFAPSVLGEDARAYFKLDTESPYMLLVAEVLENRRRQMSKGAAGPVRDRQAQRTALRHSRRHTHRLFSASADGTP
jgi:carbamoyltransferase